MNTRKYAIFSFSALTSLMPVTAMAQSLAVVNVQAPAINCVFETSCKVVVNDTTGSFSLPGDTGNGLLQSRTFPGGVGSPAAGLTGYDYRLDMTSMGGTNCVSSLLIPFGPVSSLQYDGSGGLDQMYVVTSGGLGSVGVSAAELIGTGTVSIKFADRVCPGETSYFIGLASSGGPRPMHALIGGTRIRIAARSPHR